jgi:hypothetical protein
MRKIIITLAFVILGIANQSFAATVSSFTTPRNYINSGSFLSLTWNIADGSGHSLQIDCSLGVILKNAQSGADFSCGSATSISENASDAIDLIAYNISGSAKTVSASITPKDQNGALVTSEKKMVYVTIQPHDNPIDEFTIEPLTVNSGSPLTLSWKSNVLKKVNLQMTCKDYIVATSTSYTTSTYIPCNTPIFTSDLEPKSSITIAPKNNGLNAADVVFTLLPQVSAGVYDATRSVSKTVTIKIPTTPTPTISLVKRSSELTEDGATTTIEWSSENVDGVNIQFNCIPTITAYFSSAATSTLPCDSYINQNDYPSKGSLNLYFKNSSYANEIVRVKIIPKTGPSNYDATKSLIVPFTILPKGRSTTIINGTNYQQTTTTKTATITNKNKYQFNILIKKGSSGSSVTKLQEILKTDPSIYPEGLTTGYFGLATEKAVGRFQEKYGIAKAGDVGYGTLGPKTRAKLNSL